MEQIIRVQKTHELEAIGANHENRDDPGVFKSAHIFRFLAKTIFRFE